MLTPDASSSYFQHDRHVSSSPEDEFDRYPFAEKLADMIVRHRSPHGLVIGLYGQWGEGKSSLLDFIVTALEATGTADVIVVRFNPWRFAGEDQLLMSFFAELRSTLGTELNSESITAAVNEYAQEIIARRIATDDTNLVELDKYKSSRSLEALKNEINRLIQESGKRILILVDDIDRLNKREIEATLRLVKLTGDFNYTTYLLALDQHMVADAIGKRYPGRSQEAGRKFLEKIIQVPLYLPAVQEESMRSFFQKRLDSVLTSTGHFSNLLEAERERYTNALNQSIVPRITTPRHINRLLNTLLVIIPLLDGEANVADIILIESLRIFYPKWYKFIKKNRRKVTGTFDAEYRKLEHNKLDDVCGQEGENFGKARSIIFALFPKLRELYRKHEVYIFDRDAKRTDEDLNQSHSIASPYYFKRYFSYAVQAGEVPEKDIRVLFKNVIDGNIEDASAQAVKIIERSSDSELLRRLESILPNIPRNTQQQPNENAHVNLATTEYRQALSTTAGAINFTKLLVSLSPNLRFQNVGERALRPLSRSSGLFLSYLKFLPKEHVLPTLDLIVRESHFFEVPVELLSDLNRVFRWSDDSDLGMLKAHITPDVYSHLAQEITERLKREAATQNKPWFAVYPMQTRLLVQTWEQAYGREDMTNSLKGIFETDKESLLTFLQNISSLGRLDGVYTFSNIDKDTYQFLKEHTDEGYLYKQALKLTNDQPRMPYIDDVFHVPTLPERAHQLVHLHQNEDESHTYDVSFTEVE